MLDKIISAFTLIGFSLISGFVLWSIKDLNPIISFIISGGMFLAIAYGAIVRATNKLKHALFVELLAAVFLGFAIGQLDTIADDMGFVMHKNFYEIVMLSYFFIFLY